MNARQLTYVGNRTNDIVGSVVGPTMLGQALTIYDADYDDARGVTVAHVRPSTQHEVDNFRAQFRAPIALGGVA